MLLLRLLLHVTLLLLLLLSALHLHLLLLLLLRDQLTCFTGCEVLVMADVCCCALVPVQHKGAVVDVGVELVGVPALHLRAATVLRELQLVIGSHATGRLLLLLLLLLLVGRAGC
jgi:hypothetical protein